MEIVSFQVNGHRVSRAVPSSMTLLEFLREELHLTGTKRGCDLGECGCCTVLINGAPQLSCLTLALDLQDAEIITIEGIAENSKLHPVQQAFIDEGALQCGFCTPSMIINGVSLFNQKKSPTSEEVKECISGTICRCTGYVKIEKAINKACHKG